MCVCVWDREIERERDWEIESGGERLNDRCFYLYYKSWFDLISSVSALHSCERGTEKYSLLLSLLLQYTIYYNISPQLGAADAEIKVPSGENTELKHSPFQAWSRSVYSRTCYAYCQGVLPCLFLPFQSIHLHFFPKPLPIFSCVGLQNKIAHPARCRFPCWVPAAYK